MPGAGVSTCSAAWPSESVGQFDDSGRDAARVVAEVEPQVGGDLVVARPAGAQFAAERAETFEQPAFERGVHVLVVGRRHELPRRAGRLEVVQRRQHAAEFVGGQQIRPGQDAGMRP